MDQVAQLATQNQAEAQFAELFRQLHVFMNVVGVGMIGLVVVIFSLYGLMFVRDRMEAAKNAKGDAQ